MNHWLAGYEDETRPIIQLNGEFVTFASRDEHEEALVVLTDDYRDASGDFIPPEIVAWCRDFRETP